MKHDLINDTAYTTVDKSYLGKLTMMDSTMRLKNTILTIKDYDTDHRKKCHHRGHHAELIHCLRACAISIRQVSDRHQIGIGMR